MGEKKARWNAGCKAKIVYDSKYVELHRRIETETKKIIPEIADREQINKESKKTE